MINFFKGIILNLIENSFNCIGGSEEDDKYFFNKFIEEIENFLKKIKSTNLGLH